MEEKTKLLLFQAFVAEGLNPMLSNDNMKRIYDAIPEETRNIMIKEKKEKTLKAWQTKLTEADNFVRDLSG